MGGEAQMIKHEIAELPSRYPNGVLMYPGRWLLTWAKCGAMPWVLIGMESAP